jgi:hypothetical protein
MHRSFRPASQEGHLANNIRNKGDHPYRRNKKKIVEKTEKQQKF